MVPRLIHSSGTPFHLSQTAKKQTVIPSSQATGACDAPLGAELQMTTEYELHAQYQTSAGTSGLSANCRCRRRRLPRHRQVHVGTEALRRERAALPHSGGKDCGLRNQRPRRLGIGADVLQHFSEGSLNRWATSRQRPRRPPIAMTVRKEPNPSFPALTPANLRPIPKVLPGALTASGFPLRVIAVPFAFVGLSYLRR